MKRVRRLAQFWNWLPAFRAVAESEHLPTAAAELGVSAPGLSRTVKLIEHELGQELFARRSRRLELNRAGRLVLEHVRDAMRRVDDGVEALAGLTFSGPLRVAASSSVSQVLVLPALELLAERHDQLVPELVSMEEQAALTALRKGQLDVALIEHTEVPQDLDLARLGTTTYSIYCGARHPLARRRRLTLDECLDRRFVGPAGDAADSWPLNLRRAVGCKVAALNLAVEICAEGRYLALLPDEVAARRGKALRRLPLEPLAETPIFVVRRQPLGVRDRAAALCEALAEVAALAPSSPSPTEPNEP